MPPLISRIKDFDGDPVQIYEPKGDDPVTPPDTPTVEEGEATYGDEPVVFPEDTGGGKPAKYYVDDVEVIVATERVQYLDAEGKLITESLKDYTRKTIQKEFQSLDDFLNKWNETDRKQAVLDELSSKGVFLHELSDQVGNNYDAFDLICHIAFDQPPLTRQERANNVKERNVFGKYGDKARAILNALLDKYADGGLKSVESLEILKVEPLTAFGTPVEIVDLFGGKKKYLSAIEELEAELYKKAA